jgi:hypothetical protein
LPLHRSNPYRLFYFIYSTKIVKSFTTNIQTYAAKQSNNTISKHNDGGRRSLDTTIVSLPSITRESGRRGLSPVDGFAVAHPQRPEFDSCQG